MDSNTSVPVVSTATDQVKSDLPMEQDVESNSESKQSPEETSSVIPPKSEEKEN